MRLKDNTVVRLKAFLDTQPEGSTFVSDDFREFGTYACIRSAIVRMCKNNVLIRLCQGVYMKTGAKVPDKIYLAKEIARRSGAKARLKEDEKKGGTRILTFYTTGSTRSMILEDGTVIKYTHVDRL